MATGKLRQVTWGVAAGGGVTFRAMALTFAAGRAVDASWPTPDANIGLGLLMLAAPAVAIPLGVWYPLRQLRVPAAGLVATGTVLPYLGACLPFAGSAWPGRIVVATVLVAAYTGAMVGVLPRKP